MPNRDRQSSFSAKSKKKKQNLPPTKPKNHDVRKREYLTTTEVKQLRDAAKHSRNGFRDYWLITMLYRHGLRVSEAIDLKWEQVDFRHARLHVSRLKNGDDSVHFIEGDELRAMRRLKRENPDSDFIFTSERGSPLSPRAVHAIVARAGDNAGITFPCHPHMLRHSRGFKLASRGEDTRAIQAYLGHKNIQHTVLYTKLDPKRFKGFSSD
ncbi:MAG: tyrosine-type recombinase/integrase [Candidatus Obscuribacterales bacterium]|nr:tyrosine-type recombinase/integrase [Candidatus Obscuribacterales bacterium]